jgi:Tfp pilus assembly protein PilO
MKALIPIICIALAGFLFYWYIDPTYAQIKELRTEEATLNQALTRALELQETRDQLVSRFNTFPSSDLTRLEKLLPDHVDNVRLVLDLDSLASQYGMRVRNVAIEKADKKGKQVQQTGSIGPDERLYESMVLSFTATGTYDTLRQFMIDLEKSLRLVDIEAISFSAGDGELYDVTIAVRTYWLKP